MALTVNCDGFQRERYFSRSWALITQDEGWIKPILLLTLAQLVPILGPLGVSGYIVEWARLIAWNTNAAPKQSNVNIGECIVSGWRTFLVSIGWGILIGLAVMVLALVPIIGPLLAFAASIFCIFLGQLLRVAILRASIYQQVGAGYKAARIWEMGERDVDGLMRIIAIEIFGSLIISVLFCVVGTIIFAVALPSFIQLISQLDSMTYVDSAQEAMVVFQQIFDVFLGFAPTFVIMGLIASFLSIVLSLIVTGATGLWMRQFNVAAWGRSDDPLPQPLPETVFYYQNAPVDPNQAYGYGYQAQQPTYDQYNYAAQQQAYEQAYNQAYEQAYGQGHNQTYAPQQTEPVPEVQYVPEAAVVPEAAYIAEPETAPIAEPVAAPEPDAVPISEPIPVPENPDDAE